MSGIPPNTQVWSTFRTTDTAPELPDLKGRAVIDHDVGKYHPDARSEIRARLDEIEPQQLVQALQNAGVRVSRYFLTIHTLPEFWDDPPEDYVGALLAPDGHVAMGDSALYWQIVPLTEPLYTLGRPEPDSDHSRYKPHVLRAGGIPIVSDELLVALRQLGAEGETGDIIYRGFNKAAYNTAQRGFQRFLPCPEYNMPCSGGFEFLPEATPIHFALCAMLRFWEGLTERVPGIPGNPANDRWYDIAVGRRSCDELRRSRKSILLTPIFRLGGTTHRWMSDLDAAVEALQV